MKKSISFIILSIIIGNNAFSQTHTPNNGVRRAKSTPLCVCKDANNETATVYAYKKDEQPGTLFTFITKEKPVEVYLKNTLATQLDEMAVSTGYVRLENEQLKVTNETLEPLQKFTNIDCIKKALVSRLTRLFAKDNRSEMSKGIVSNK